MPVEQGFIEYEFTQRGAENVSRTVRQLDKDIKGAASSFEDYEREVRGVTNAELSAEKGMRALGKSAREATSAQDGLGRSAKFTRDELLSGRYAAYDLASTYATIGASMIALGGYAITMGAQFESAFTNVERTLDPLELVPGQIQDIRQELIQMTGQMPLAFSEIAEIATIGNQMGIAADELTDFTGTMARFASVSGMSIDEVTKAFGGFMAQTGLGAEYLENLGSAISLVGIRSNATEAEILSVSREIAALSENSGFAADEIVGLAGTLSSLRVPPERSRGSLGTYFGTLRKAVAEGGVELQNFATVVGVTAEELDRMVRSGQGAEVLEGFLRGLNDLDSVDTTRALNELGLAQLRVEDTFIRLGNRIDLFREYMGIANQGFIEGAELNRQYEMTMQDLNSQWVIFINGLNGIVDAITGGAIPSIAGLLSGVNQLLFGFQAWLNDNPWAGKIIAIGTAMVAVVGIMAVMRGASFALRGSMLAYLFVAQQTGIANMGLVGTLRAVAGSMNAVNGTARGAATGLRIFRAALVSTGIGAAIVGLGFLGEKLLDMGGSAKDASINYDQFLKATKSSGSAMSDAADGAGSLADQLGGGGSGGGGVAGAAKKATEEIRTLVDYANDLSGVLSRSFELRFSSQAAMDNVTKKWIELNEEMQEYQRTIRSLTADRSLKAYWLSIAEAYDDQLRAGQLREELAKIDDELAEANAGASRELEGNSKSAIENRKVITDLIGGYEDYIVALAKSGASQDFIRSEINRLNKEFMSQGTALGYSADELSKYALSFRDFEKIVSRVQPNVTVGFNSDPAEQALAEFFAKAQKQAEEAGAGMGDALGGGMGAGIPSYDDLGFEPMLFRPMIVGATKSEGFWDGFWTGIKRTAINAADVVVRAVGGIVGAIDYLYSARWTEGISLWDSMKEQADIFSNDFKSQFGEIGDEGAAALNSSFGHTFNPGAEISGGMAKAKLETNETSASTGAFVATSFNRGLKGGLLPAPIIKDGVNNAKSQSNAAASSVGTSTAGSFNSGLSKNLSVSSRLTSAINNSASSAQASADWVGASVGGAFMGGLGRAIRNNPVNIKNSAGGVLAALGGYAMGGYTGAGGWLQPAGIVHRGEYVIPKKYVDQRTKLPSMDYVASLNRGQKASRGSVGFAGGGYASGVAQPVRVVGGMLDLGARTMSGLNSQSGYDVRIGDAAIAKSASRGSRSSAMVGSA